jgi:hypothetical protein
MRTFVFAVFETGNDLVQEVVQAADEFEAAQIFVSDSGYMSYHDTRQFGSVEELFDEIYDTCEAHISYIELE